MKTPFARAASAPPAQIPVNFLADDATAADQLALGVYEMLGRRVITTDVNSLDGSNQVLDERCVRVINTGTRALPADRAQAQNASLARRIFAGRNPLPMLQIDSRLRGIGNALRGIYDSLDFDYLLFVPAEPELGRLVRSGVFYHVENSSPVPFHQSTLSLAADPRPTSSHLGEFLSHELELPTHQFWLLDEAVMEAGPNSIVKLLREGATRGKLILIPDITKADHFDTMVAAIRMLGGHRFLIAGSRTFLRSVFHNCDGPQVPPHRGGKTFVEAIDRQHRGAPLAVMSSLEPAMHSQIEYVRRALGPNLVMVEFNSATLRGGDTGIKREVDRVQSLLVAALKASRPVLLHTSRVPAFTNASKQQEQLDRISAVIADPQIQAHTTALFISGGQAAETIKKALRISAIEILGAFQENVPWGLALQGPFEKIPIVTKGGRMGREDILFRFFEEFHPLPRANVLPVVTPLTRLKEVDPAGIERLCAHLIRLGTTDIFAVGNAGEFRFLTNEQRLKALKVFASKWPFRLFAGITGDTADQTRENYKAASELGVWAAVIMPLYFLKSSEEIVPFVQSLASIEPTLPLILYNNPERTKGQNISFEAVEALEFPVVAIKDSTGDLDRLDRYARSMPVYEGQQRQIFEGWQHGARGSIGIIGHVTSLPNEFYASETTAVRREEIVRQINDLSKVVKQGGSEVAAYKYILSLAGIIGDTVASNEPSRELTEAQREQIRVNNAELIDKFRIG